MQQSHFTRSASALLALCSFLLLGCPDEKKEQIKLGSLLSLTGSLSSYGQANLEGIQLAMEEINAAGGVLGKELAVVSADDATSATVAGTAAQQLVDSGVPATVGALGSGFSLKALEVLGPASVVMVSPAATSPAMTTTDPHGFFFRVVPSDALQGKVLAQRAVASGATKVAVLYRDDAYGQGLLNAFKANYADTTHTIVGEHPYSVDPAPPTSFQTLLGTIYSQNPDAILAASYEEVAQIIKDYDSYYRGGHASTKWFFSDGAGSSAIVTASGSTFDFFHEITVPSSTSTSPRWASFASAYSARFGRAPEAGKYVGQAYDATYLIALAIAQAKDATGPAVRDNLVSVSGGGAVKGATEIGEALQMAAAGQDLDFDGVTGSLDFDASGDQLHAVYDVMYFTTGASPTLTVKVSNVVP